MEDYSEAEAQTRLGMRVQAVRTYDGRAPGTTGVVVSTEWTGEIHSRGGGCYKLVVEWDEPGFATSLVSSSDYAKNLCDREVLEAKQRDAIARENERQIRAERGLLQRLRRGRSY